MWLKLEPGALPMRNLTAALTSLRSSLSRSFTTSTAFLDRKGLLPGFISNPRRVLIGGIVALLHAALVLLLIAGLRLDASPKAPAEITMLLDPGGTRAVRGAPPVPDLVKIDEPVVTPPEITVDETPQTAISVNAATGDAGATVPAEAIAAAHTVPPLTGTLLAQARRDMLRLLLNIATDGSVSAAVVQNSTGSPQIDSLAVDWVKAHWRYKPALHDGQAIAVTTIALVPF